MGKTFCMARRRLSVWWCPHRTAYLRHRSRDPDYLAMHRITKVGSVAGPSAGPARAVSSWRRSR